jgi:hypothetical protein
MSKPKVTHTWTIKIGKHRWRIERLAARTIRNPNKPKQRVVGLCYPSLRLIQYCGGKKGKPVSRRSRLDTLIHEGVHAVIAEAKVEELLATTIAKLLTAFLSELKLTDD